MLQASPLLVPVLEPPLAPGPAPCNAASTAALPRQATSSTTSARMAVTAAELLAAGPVGAAPAMPWLAAARRRALQRPTAMPGRKKASAAAAGCASGADSAAVAEPGRALLLMPSAASCCCRPATAVSSCSRASSAVSRTALLPLLPRCASASASCAGQTAWQRLLVAQGRADKVKDGHRSERVSACATCVAAWVKSCARLRAIFHCALGMQPSAQQRPSRSPAKAAAVHPHLQQQGGEVA